MKKILLILLFLFIQPVSNELILKNMELSPLAINQTQTINQMPSLAFASGYLSYTAYAADGTRFTVTYWVGYGLLVGKNAAYVLNDGGLDLDSYYNDELSLIAAVNEAIRQYNMSMSLSTVLPLFLFLSLYITYEVFRQKRIREIRHC